MELAAIVIERPGTELVYVTVVILQDLFHGPGVTGAGHLDHCKGQRLLISGLLHSAIPPVSLVLMVSSVLVLCRCFCDSDDISYTGLHPKLIWERSMTLGRGNDRCDFCMKVR